MRKKHQEFMDLK
jgi:hypothetical protein